MSIPPTCALSQPDPDSDSPEAVIARMMAGRAEPGPVFRRRQPVAAPPPPSPRPEPPPIDHGHGLCSPRHFDSLCQWCRDEITQRRTYRAPRLPARPPTWREEWTDLLQDYPILADASGHPLREPVPERPDPAEVARLAAMLLHPDSRPLLADVLSVVLADRVGAAIDAALQRQQHVPPQRRVG